jgi:hypothetical protein
MTAGSGVHGMPGGAIIDPYPKPIPVEAAPTPT